MRHWSIRRKIVFWYTFVFAALIGVELYLFFTTSTRVLVQQATERLTQAVEEIENGIEIEDDGVYLDWEDESDRFRFEHDSVRFLIYRDETLTYGTPPADFQESTPLHPDDVKQVETTQTTWLVYDLDIGDDYVLRGLYDMDLIAGSFRQVFLIAAGLSTIIILLAAAGGIVIIQRSFRPIATIYQTASDITKEQDYSKRIPVQPTRDEIQELADMVNRMLVQVEQSLHREKRFSANVSHELRTPLTVMHSQVEYLLAKAEQPTEQTAWQSVMHQIVFMEQMVSQLLELTRTKRIKPEEMELVNLSDLIVLSAESLREKMEEKHIALTIHVPSEPIVTKVHQTFMIRALSNLIMNAIKYNRPQGSIHIDLEPHDGWVTLRIRDTGIGMSEDETRHIFDVFYRADESRTQSDSLGLGLTMVQEIIRLHEGTIEVHSVMGEGTTFVIQLPRP
jgi:signal transduction histidine kinase